MPQGRMNIKYQMMLEWILLEFRGHSCLMAWGLKDDTMRKEALTSLLKKCAGSTMGKGGLEKRWDLAGSAETPATCLPRQEILKSTLLTLSTLQPKRKFKGLSLHLIGVLKNLWHWFLVLCCPGTPNLSPHHEGASLQSPSS